MSKGGSNNRSSSSSSVPVEPPEKPIYPNLPEALEFDPYYPGQKEGIIEQMVRGYGDTYDAQEAHLDKTNVPTVIPRLHEPLTVTQEALKSGEWNLPDANYTTGSFALDKLLGLPSSLAANFTATGGVAPTNVATSATPQDQELNILRQDLGQYR